MRAYPRPRVERHTARGATPSCSGGSSRLVFGYPFWSARLEGAVARVLKEGLGDTTVDRSEVEALRRQFADLDKRVAG